jgi:hypothetical protein
MSLREYGTRCPEFLAVATFECACAIITAGASAAQATITGRCPPCLYPSRATGCGLAAVD